MPQAYPYRMNGLLMLVVLATTVLCDAATVRAQSSEYKVKLAYIYNFCRYVDWPEEAFTSKDSPFVIGVVGPNPFGKLLQTLAKQKTIKGHPIVVKRFRSLKDYQPCHVLFVADTPDQKVLRLALDRTRASPTLIIGESDGFASAGASVNFYLDVDGTIGFEINIDATNRKQLRVNAKLLKLAKIVRDQNHE